MQDDRRDTVVRSDRRNLGSNHARGLHMSAGGAHVIFGLVFVSAGTFVMLLSLGVIQVDRQQFHVPEWVVTVVGLVFAIAGVLISLNGVRASLRRRRLRENARRYPNEPWRADHDWEPHRSRDEATSRWTGFLFGGLFVALFGVPFLYIGLAEDGASRIFAIGGTLVLCFAFGLLVYSMILLVRRLKFGRGRLEYDRDVFHPGDRFQAQWTGTASIGAWEQMIFTLRCIEEKIETRKSDKNTQRYYDRIQLWEARQTIAGPGQHMAGDPIDLNFELPENRPSTDLMRDPPRYWEVEMHAVTPGVDFHQRFLIPVYARPS